MVDAQIIRTVVASHWRRYAFEFGVTSKHPDWINLICIFGEATLEATKTKELSNQTDREIPKSLIYAGASVAGTECGHRLVEMVKEGRL